MRIIGLAFAALAAVLLSLAQENLLPEGKAKPIVEHTCTECHGLQKIFDKEASAAAWREIVTKMRSGGATMTDAEFETVVAYLVENFAIEDGAGPAPAAAAKTPARINVNKADAAEIEAALSLAPTQAAAIVHYREKNGAFKEWRDLLKVEGIDRDKIEANKDRLTF